ncbi:hypothetical protein MHYP_G00342440 [Metynnis hypsauchen]
MPALFSSLEPAGFVPQLACRIQRTPFPNVLNANMGEIKAGHSGFAVWRLSGVVRVCEVVLKGGRERQDYRGSSRERALKPMYPNGISTETEQKQLAALPISIHSSAEVAL